MADTGWTTSTHSQRLLASVADTASRRKYRLLGVACCRLIFPLLDHRLRQSVETVERFAEGNGTDADITAAGEVALAVVSERKAEANAVGRDANTDTAVLAADAVSTLASTDEEMIRDASPFWPGDPLCEYIAAVLSLAAKTAGNQAVRSPEQADLVRDIFAEEFHPVTFLPEWRTHTAVAVAQVMYTLENFSAMLVLADALEEAGCDQRAILDHCRGSGPHVRGCWVVDRLLGKE